MIKGICGVASVIWQYGLCPFWRWFVFALTFHVSKLYSSILFMFQSCFFCLDFLCFKVFFYNFFMFQSSFCLDFLCFKVVYVPDFFYVSKVFFNFLCFKADCVQMQGGRRCNCPTNVAVKDYFEVCNRSTREHPKFQNTKMFLSSFLAR